MYLVFEVWFCHAFLHLKIAVRVYIMWNGFTWWRHCLEDVKGRFFFYFKGRQYNRDFSPVASFWQEMESIHLWLVYSSLKLYGREGWEESEGKKEEERKKGNWASRVEQAAGTFSNNTLSAETFHMSALQKFPHYYLFHIPSESFKYSFALTFYSVPTVNCLKTGNLHF